VDVVRLHNVDYLRGDRLILADVSWTIRPGQHWALLGANGSGKTTLLKIITRYEWSSDGAVQVLGQDFGNCNIPALRRRIGYASSALADQLHGHLVGRDTALNIVASGIEASIGLYREFTAQEFDQARSALAKMNTPALADQHYHQLSQGEQQRVRIARALVNNPGLLILDEPCVGLDPAARELFLADLARLADRPDAPTMILVTHHIEEIGPWIGHVLVLKAGRVLAAGPKDQVLTSTILSDAFDYLCHVHRDGPFYHLRSDHKETPP